MTNKITHSIAVTTLMVLFAFGLSACDGAKPPTLMKAVKQFDSDATRDKHVKHMRKNHMDELLHKRDQTLIQGIRTKKFSMKECINCHIPEKHNGEILRHTNPEHFCSTCHGYVAQKLDCFDCHVDHPVKGDNSAKAPKINSEAHSFTLNKNEIELLAINTQSDLSSELQINDAKIITKGLIETKGSASE
ncbi:MAG: hypothetical protein V3U71_11715 [Cocleimonas sp.]